MTALFTLAAPDPDPVILAHPVGTYIETFDGPFGLATATFDDTLLYRFRLSRVWDPDLPRVNFLMLNPSTADAFVLDPTVRRCVGFAKAWGAGALEVTNAFALRSTDPRGLLEVADPVGVGNDDAILAAARAAHQVIVAWGVHAKARGQHITKLLHAHNIKVLALRLTKEGAPGHPLYVPANTVPVPYN